MPAPFTVTAQAGFKVETFSALMSLLIARVFWTLTFGSDHASASPPSPSATSVVFSSSAAGVSSAVLLELELPPPPQAATTTVRSRAKRSNAPADVIFLPRNFIPRALLCPATWHQPRRDPQRPPTCSYRTDTNSAAGSIPSLLDGETESQNSRSAMAPWARSKTCTHGQNIGWPDDGHPFPG